MKNNMVSSTKDEKGFALVIALLFSLMLLMLGTALMYSMSSFFRSLAVASQRSQNYYIATAGIEKLKDLMWNPNATNRADKCQPANAWCDQLGLPGNPVAQFRDLTGWRDTLGMEFANAQWNIWLRDNDDGDGDYGYDSDQIVIAVASGNDTATGGQVTVEAMLMYTAPTEPYENAGGSKASGNGDTGSDISDADLQAPKRQ